MNGVGGRRVWRIDQAEDLACLLVDPVFQVLDAVRILRVQICLVGAGDVFRRDASVDVVDIHVQWHSPILPVGLDLFEDSVVIEHHGCLTDRLTGAADRKLLGTHTTLAIHLLGRPEIEDESGDAYRFRSRKSWGLLAYLILAERPPTRNQLASLLFSTADDPLRALRWSLGEVRRGLGDSGSVDGDPVNLELAEGVVIDVDVVTRGAWEEAVALPSFGAELLEGATFRDAAAFESWLLSEQRYLSAATDAILHEAALASMSRGHLDESIDYAVRLVGSNPLDENHQALLIRLYRMSGDDIAAVRQMAACTDLLERELGVSPGPAITEAMATRITRPTGPVDEAAVLAIIESGVAAVGAGAIEAGVQSLRSGMAMADTVSADRLRVRARLALAGALVHSLRGQDEEGVAILHEAGDIALSVDEPGLAAEARAELGYVDFLRAKYDRAELWLLEAGRLGDTLSMRAKVATYLGSIDSDRANYSRAVSHLETALDASRSSAATRMEVYALSMLGRVHLLRSDLDEAANCLDRAIDLGERDHWLAFMPWPQALRGEVELARMNLAGASEIFDQAFARACQLGDPCWEGIAARGIALTAEANGTTDRAFKILADARSRANRLSDPYVWLDGYILDAQCELGLRHGHPATGRWIDAMAKLASRAGMKELIVRSLLHADALGERGALANARLLGGEIENRALAGLLGA